MILITYCLLILGGIAMSTITSLTAAPTKSSLSNGDIRIDFDEMLKDVPANHFFPAANMRKLLDKYSSAELELIFKDFCNIGNQTFDLATQQLDYIVTAGGPSAGKSAVLENLINGGECPDKSLDTSIVRAYIDPDRSCLLKMKNTYQADISSGARTPQEAYTHWREASNFLSNYYLARGLDKGYAIAHGSTMATPYAKNALLAIKNLYGYKTTVVHMTCDEDVRNKSEQLRRKNGVIQCTDKDFKEKQEMFLTLLADYVNCSDKVIFVYRACLDKCVWAAKVENGKLEIYDKAAFEKIQQAHDAALWEKTFPVALPK